MSTALLSTKEVAAMLNVVETTIKRWADEDIIPCVRTPGGHRRFSLREIVRFADVNGYTIAGSKLPSMSPEQLEQVELGTVSRTYGRLAEVFRAEALRADREGILDFLLYLYKNHIPVSAILDEVIRPAFQAIGKQWEAGEIAVGQEHAASQATMESLIRMSFELHRKDPNGMSALCACPEGELHELGLRGLAHSLEGEGWKVHYMGANTPLESIASFVRAVQAELVCLSITVGSHGEELDGLAALADRIHSGHGRLLLGGSYAMNAGGEGLPCDHIAASIQDAVAYTRDAFGLKPGPKKVSTSRVANTQKTPEREGPPVPPPGRKRLHR